MSILVGTTYTCGSLLHQRQVLAIDGDDVEYCVINSHAAAVIGSVHRLSVKAFARWARRAV